MSAAKPYTSEELAEFADTATRFHTPCEHCSQVEERWLATLAAEREKVRVLRSALAKVEPWAHTLNGPASLTPMVRPDGTTGGTGIASMTPFAAKSSTIQHDAECAGCAARAALAATAEKGESNG